MLAPAGNDDAVVVTGASSAISELIACEFARRGSQLVLIAHRADCLCDLAESIAGTSNLGPVPKADAAVGLCSRFVPNVGNHPGLRI